MNQCFYSYMSLFFFNTSIYFYLNKECVSAVFTISDFKSLQTHFGLQKHFFTAVLFHRWSFLLLSLLIVLLLLLLLQILVIDYMTRTDLRSGSSCTSASVCASVRKVFVRTLCVHVEIRNYKISFLVNRKLIIIRMIRNNSHFFSSEMF